MVYKNENRNLVPSEYKIIMQVMNLRSMLLVMMNSRIRYFVDENGPR